MTDDRTRDRETINALRNKHVAAINACDLQTVLSGMTEDVVYMPPGQPAILGKKNLEDYLRPIYEQAKAEISMTSEEIEVTGEWAFELGTIGGQLRLGDGPAISMNGKYLYIYKREHDGSWKIARDIYNDNAPPVGPSD